MRISDWSSDVCSSDLQGMAGIVAALEPHHHIGAQGKPVDDLALALVAPLGADNHHVAHLNSPSRQTEIRDSDGTDGGAVPDMAAAGGFGGLFQVAGLRVERRPGGMRSEEHTSEPQSLMRISYAVFC